MSWVDEFLLGRLEDAVYDALDGVEAPGCVVSGGLDSSTVTSLARLIRPGIPTFTGYYAEPGFSELEYARLVTDPDTHHEVLITPEDFVDHFDVMVAASRRPFMGAGAFGQYMVAKAVSEAGVSVVLSGEGGDELFGGYARLLIVAGRKPPVGYEDYELPAGYPRTVRSALRYDWDRLPLLLAVDEQMCGAWGVESRAPMTSHRVVEYVAGFRPDARVGKDVLRNTVKGLVPDRILERKDKRGFPIPLVKWANEHEGVRSLVWDRLGYLPDPERPWDRDWWVELCEASCEQAVAA